jgi:hypothetical protein
MRICAERFPRTTRLANGHEVACHLLDPQGG